MRLFRKIFSLQSVTEAVVREIQNILQVQPLLVLATKATIFGGKSVTNDMKRYSMLLILNTGSNIESLLPVINCAIKLHFQGTFYID